MRKQVTKEEIAKAKQYDVMTYLSLADSGEIVRLSSGQYRLKSHDSFKISNGMWYWFSRGIGGRTAVDYLIKVKGYTFPEAVMEVNRVMGETEPERMPEKKKEKQLKLPARNDNNDIARNYLLSRGIDERLVDWLLKKGLVYESCKHHSVVFVGCDAEGKPAHGSYRATDDSGLKGDYSGSNKKYCFRIERKRALSVHVYESAIDLLSDMTLCMECGIDISGRSFISTAGVSGDSGKLPLALEEYLERHPETAEVVLKLDNDFAGRCAAEAIRDSLRVGYRAIISTPPDGKDYNEYLMMVRRERLTEYK